MRRDLRIVQQPKAHARIDLMVEFLLAVRIAAGKVEPQAAVTGSPMPDGAPLSALQERCWFRKNWFNTPLART